MCVLKYYYKHETSSPFGNPSSTEREYWFVLAQREPDTIDLYYIAHPRSKDHTVLH